MTAGARRQDCRRWQDGGVRHHRAWLKHGPLVGSGPARSASAPLRRHPSTRPGRGTASNMPRLLAKGRQVRREQVGVVDVELRAGAAVRYGYVSGILVGEARQVA